MFSDLLKALICIETGTAASGSNRCWRTHKPAHPFGAESPTLMELSAIGDRKSLLCFLAFDSAKFVFNHSLHFVNAIHCFVSFVWTPTISSVLDLNQSSLLSFEFF